MFKHFLNGLFFGTGFSLAFFGLLYVSLILFILPATFGPQEFDATSRANSIKEYEVSQTNNTLKKSTKLELPFRGLGIDDQILHSSVIILAKYKPGADGKVRAVISDILKKEDGTEFYYEIGDEYHDASYYPRDRTDYGDGSVIFFTGSPASIKMSMSYSGDRIRSLGDLPINLLRKKCKEANT
jgi:hypothetical protein